MGSVLGRHVLVPHPDAPPGTVEQVVVDVAAATIGGAATGELWIEFHLAPSDHLFLPATARPRRADGLWKTTCFELFAKCALGESYFEFNFSPSLQWAAYAFDGYRSGVRQLPAKDPGIAVAPTAPNFCLTVKALPALPPVAMRIGLSAVIEEKDGTKSYWALTHPARKPDFHHPDGFVLDLPAR